MKIFFVVLLVLGGVLGTRADRITLIAPAQDALVSQLNDIHKKYQSLPRKERVAYFASVEKRKEMKRAGDHPVPVSFLWTWEGKADAAFTVKLATDSAFEHCVGVCGASASNLLIATTYYWKVSAKTENGIIESKTGVFKTEDRTPRLLTFDKIPNVRDLGGYKTKSGRRVRQGLLYRTAGLNNNAHDATNLPCGFRPGENRLTEEGRRYVVETLGVKSDLDLRTDKECRGMTGSPLGPAVTWFHISSSAYGGMQKKDGKEAFKKDFRLFLDKKNYPIVFHCIAGQDRTGSLAFILNGLLGVDEENLYLDWEYTGFYNPDLDFNHRKRFNKLVNGFQSFPGTTLNDKVEAYVLSLGFTQADLAIFRGIMLE